MNRWGLLYLGSLCALSSELYCIFLCGDRTQIVAPATVTDMSQNYTNQSSTMSTITATKHNLPEHVRQVAGLRGEVITWTQIDPNLENKVGRYACCRSFGFFVFLPCFWPHLLIIWPCLWSAAAKVENAARSQYWILTEQELRIVSLDHDVCCIAGCIKSGVTCKAIPLENITDAGLAAIGTGCINTCAVDLPTIYVDTASSGMTANGVGHEATGLALANYESFIRHILDGRDACKTGQRSGPAAMSMQRVDNTGYVGDKSSAGRIADIKELHEAGILSQQEYDQKRKEIISSM